MHVGQMHWEAMSGYGNAYVRTPNLDRVAADGCSFRGSYTANSTMLSGPKEPGHASYLRGSLLFWKS